MMLLLMEGAAERLAGFLVLPLGDASGLFPAQHRCRMLPPSQAQPSPACPWWLPPSSPPAVLRPRSAAWGPRRGQPPPTRPHMWGPQVALPNPRAGEDAMPRRRCPPCTMCQHRPCQHHPGHGPGLRSHLLAREGFWGRGGGEKGWVTCRTGAGAWGSRTSRFRQQRGERRKMPQTPLERWSGTGRQSWRPQEGSVAPARIADTGTLPKSTHSSQNRHQRQKTLLPRFSQSWKFLHKACQGGFGWP